MDKTLWEWEYKHIYGHQDRHIPYQQLDIWAQLNIDCDQSAGMHCTKLKWNNNDATNLHIYCLPWQVYINDYKVLDDICRELYSYVYKESMFNYWAQHKYNPCTVPMEVNWEAIKPQQEQSHNHTTMAS